MGTVTLLPDLTVAEKGLFTTDGTAASALAALQGTDASWVRNNGSGNTYAGTYRFGALSLPAGAVVSSVKMSIRYSHAQYLNDFEMIQPESVLVGRLQGTAHSFYTFTSGEHPTLWAEGTTVNVWTGPARVQGFDGDYIGKLLVDNPTARLYGSVLTARNTVWNTARIYRLELIVTYNERPSVTVQQPTGSISVSRPPVAWTMTDPDGDTQKVVQVKFYTQAQYSAGGFNPDTSTPTDFYNLWRTIPNLTPTRPITPNGTWRAYVRTAQFGVSGMEMWSPWAFSQFTLATDGPAIPVVSAVHDPSVNAIHVTTTGSLPGGHSSYSVGLQRSLDAEATWEDIPPELTELTGTSLSYWDYRLEGGQTVSYRAQARSVNASGDPVSSNWSAGTSALMPPFDDWWLRDLTDPIGLSMPLRVTPGFTERITIPQTVGYGLDDTAATVTTDGPKAGPLPSEIDLLDETAYDDFKQMITSGNTLLLQDVLGRAWYVRPGETVDFEMMHAAPTQFETTPVRHAHRVSVEWIVVEPPSG